MRVLGCGSRQMSVTDFHIREAKKILEQEGTTVLIEGGAKGGDTVWRFAALSLGIPIETYKADWEKNGRSAGPIRNRKMLVEGKPDAVFAFKPRHSDMTKGTQNMVNIALKANVKVFICEYEGEK